jgi:hypothetical protein
MPGVPPPTTTPPCPTGAASGRPPLNRPRAGGRAAGGSGACRVGRSPAVGSAASGRSGGRGAVGRADPRGVRGLPGRRVRCRARRGRVGRGWCKSCPRMPPPWVTPGVWGRSPQRRRRRGGEGPPGAGRPGVVSILDPRVRTEGNGRVFLDGLPDGPGFVEAPRFVPGHRLPRLPPLPVRARAPPGGLNRRGQGSWVEGDRRPEGGRNRARAMKAPDGGDLPQLALVSSDEWHKLKRKPFPTMDLGLRQACFARAKSNFVHYISCGLHGKHREVG